MNDDATVTFWIPGFEYPITVLPGALEEIIKAPKEPKLEPKKLPDLAICPQGRVGKYVNDRETIAFLPTNSAMFSTVMALPPGPPFIFSM
ncbi:hypothetical protein [Sinorhizobium meliloti]|uniref:hypothetical protein n=1 Tax=Rhizobium meliloti TaxID=382 RepID=UPI00299F016E|nr:hypothetical protein [Sinorhizobium meliloti]